MDLIDFILAAKKAGYASVGSGSFVQMENGHKRFKYSTEGYAYQDTYFGLNPFSGQEIIWKLNVACWTMNYYGYFISKTEEADINTTYGFLREAMKQIDRDHPFRGPKEFRDNDFVYHNQQFGTVEHFWGVERVFFSGSEVYILNYHGGTLTQF